MKVEIDFRKSVPENAARYYEMAKKEKKKIPGLLKAIEKTKAEIRDLDKRIKEEKEKAEKGRKKKRERDWYERFHWFFSSDGILVIGGRDARTNAALVKKYMQDKDLFFHADIKGGSVVLAKSEGREIPESTKREAAEFAASFSKAFSLGLGAVSVYCVRPEQVKLAAKAGEFLPKGGFVIEGKREWFKDARVAVAISYDQNRKRVVSGPESAIARYGKYLLVVPGNKDKGEVAKIIKAKLEAWFKDEIDINEVISMLPGGKCNLHGLPA